MARPTLILSADKQPTAASGTGWSDTSAGGSLLNCLTIGFSAFEAGIGTIGTATGPLDVDMATFTPAADEIIYGLRLRIRNWCIFTSLVASRLQSVPIKVLLTLGGGITTTLFLTAKRLEPSLPPYPNLPPSPSSPAEDLDFDIYTADLPRTAWDLSSFNIKFYLNTQVSGFPPNEGYTLYVGPITYNAYTFIPPSWTPEFSAPFHNRELHGVNQNPRIYFNQGGHYAPGIYVPLYPAGVVTAEPPPDAFRVRQWSAGVQPMQPITKDYGIIRPVRDDGGILVPKLELTNNDGTTPNSNFVGVSPGWLIPISGQYYWEDWDVKTAKNYGVRPQPPTLSISAGTDLNNITVLCHDNLLSQLWTTIVGSVQTSALGPQNPILGADTTITWVAAPANIRTDLVPQLTRQTTSGAISFETPKVPVKFSAAHAASCFFKTSAATTTQLNIRWYQADGTFISSSTVDSDNQTAFTLMQGQATAPANAVWAAVELLTGSVAAGTTLEVHSLFLGRYNGSTIPQHATGGMVWGNIAAEMGSDAGGPFGSLAAGYSYVDEHSPGGTLTQVTTAPRTGTYHLQFITVGTCTLALFSPKCFLPEDFPAGLKISARAYIRSVTTQGLASLGLRFLDVDGQTISDHWGTQALTSTSTYAAYKISNITVPQGAVTYEFLIGLPTGGAITYYIDDISAFYASALPNDGVNCPVNPTTYYPEAGHLGFMVLERQASGPSDWVQIAVQQVDPSVDWVFTDYFKSEGQTVRYRARVYGLQSAQFIEGQLSSVASQTLSIPSATFGWTLWDPTVNYGPVRIDLNADDGSLSVNLMSDQAAFTPVGRTRRVFTKDVQKGQTFALTIDNVSSDVQTFLVQFHKDRRPLILQRRDTAECWYVMLVGDMTVQVQNTSPLRYIVQVKAEEVEVPPIW